MKLGYFVFALFLGGLVPVHAAQDPACLIPGSRSSVSLSALIASRESTYTLLKEKGETCYNNLINNPQIQHDPKLEYFKKLHDEAKASCDMEKMIGAWYAVMGDHRNIDVRTRTNRCARIGELRNEFDEKTGNIKSCKSEYGIGLVDDGILKGCQKPESIPASGKKGTD